MRQLLPPMTPQPPPEYVAFVARHLLELRRDAARLAGDEYGAHELYPRALTDVAIRWEWFALLRRLKRPEAADAYLHETLVRRSTRRQAEQDSLVDIEVWCSDDPRSLYPPPGRRRLDSTPPDRPEMPAEPPPARTSAALRLLPTFSLGVDVGPVAEAAVAWWYAYVAHRRARIVGIVMAIVVAMATLVRLADG
jgi:hypothetical protein